MIQHLLHLIFKDMGLSLIHIYGLFMSVRELEALYGKDAMITEEFERLAAGVRMNRPVEQLLAEFGEDVYKRQAVRSFPLRIPSGWTIFHQQQKPPGS